MDQEKAVAWYRRAAEQGLAKAQAALGYCYSNGKGWQKIQAGCRVVSQGGGAGRSRGKTTRWLLEWGAGVCTDYAEAVKWFSKAAEQGYAIAQNNLGESYARWARRHTRLPRGGEMVSQGGGAGRRRVQDNLGRTVTRKGAA